MSKLAVREPGAKRGHPCVFDRLVEELGSCEEGGHMSEPPNQNETSQWARGTTVADAMDLTAHSANLHLQVMTGSQRQWAPGLTLAKG
jgi:hypothetical protein